MDDSEQGPKRAAPARYYGLLIAVGLAAGAFVWFTTRDEVRPTATAAQRGEELFNKEFAPAEGLGPLFNEQACSTCHAKPDVGGMGPDGLATVVRVGRLTDAGFDDTFRRQRIEAHAHSISELGADCERVAGIPAGANVTSVRNTPPLFGSGLINAISDETIRAGAVRKPGGVSGEPNIVRRPDGSMDVGRFGWKADIPTLELMVAQAFRSELGITSPLAPAESLPEGLERCEGERSEPEIEAGDVSDVAAFLAELPAPQPSTSHPRGEGVFEDTGCASCHVPSLPAGEREVPLYSDLLLHDMGPALDDGVVQGSARGAEWRTTPLWGLSDRRRFLHDGRAETLEAAILAHGGEAEAARERFRSLSNARLQDLLDFLRSL